jgi:hypothetical protein
LEPPQPFSCNGSWQTIGSANLPRFCNQLTQDLSNLQVTIVHSPGIPELVRTHLLTAGTFKAVIGHQHVVLAGMVDAFPPSTGGDQYHRSVDFTLYARVLCDHCIEVVLYDAASGAWTYLYGGPPTRHIYAPPPSVPAANA